MGIPPSRLPPSSSGSESSSSDRVQDGKSKKDFKLPNKTDQEGGKQGKLMEMAKEQQSIKGQLSQGEIAAETASQTTAAASVAKVGELISQMVAQLGVGVVGGKDFASIELKGTAEIPEFLANTTLSLTATNSGLVVNFSNFESLSQQQTAILTIEQQTEQLQQLVNNLQAKGIQLADLQIGTHSITLPTPQAITPIQPPPISPEAQREEGQRGGQDQGGEGPEGGPE